jgi:hypothetical protein
MKNTQCLRIWELECRRKSASSLVKADLRPHSSKFSVLENLGVGVQTQVCFKSRKGGLASALQQVFSSKARLRERQRITSRSA